MSEPTLPPPPSVTPSKDPNIIEPASAKDPVLILILALFFGGIAYFPLGQWQKGIAAVAVWLCAIVFVFITCGIGAFLYMPLVVAMIIDAYMQAQLLKQGTPIRQWTFFSQHA